MSEELVTFATEHGAEIARASSWNPMTSMASWRMETYRIASSLEAGMSGIRLQVRPEGESRARSLLAEVPHRSLVPKGDHGIDTGGPACRKPDRQ